MAETSSLTRRILTIRGELSDMVDPGSPDTNNRTIQQATFDWIQTFWKDRMLEHCSFTRSIRV